MLKRCELHWRWETHEKSLMLVWSSHFHPFILLVWNVRHFKKKKNSYAWCIGFSNSSWCFKTCHFEELQLLTPTWSKNYNSFATCIKKIYYLPFCFIMHTCINIVSNCHCVNFPSKIFANIQLMNLHNASHLCKTH